jgi:hypothetical protein
MGRNELTKIVAIPDRSRGKTGGMSVDFPPAEIGVEVVSRRLARSSLMTGMSQDQVRQQNSAMIEDLLGSFSWALDDDRKRLIRGAITRGTEEVLSGHRTSEAIEMSPM